MGDGLDYLVYSKNINLFLYNKNQEIQLDNKDLKLMFLRLIIKFIF